MVEGMWKAAAPSRREHSRVSHSQSHPPVLPSYSSSHLRSPMSTPVPPFGALPLPPPPPQIDPPRKGATSSYIPWENDVADVPSLQWGSTLATDQSAIHSTISQDRTAGEETVNRQLLALLAQKLQITQLLPETSRQTKVKSMAHNTEPVEFPTYAPAFYSPPPPAPPLNHSLQARTIRALPFAQPSLRPLRHNPASSWRQHTGHHKAVARQQTRMNHTTPQISQPFPARSSDTASNGEALEQVGPYHGLHEKHAKDQDGLSDSTSPSTQTHTATFDGPVLVDGSPGEILHEPEEMFRTSQHKAHPKGETDLQQNTSRGEAPWEGGHTTVQNDTDDIAGPVDWRSVLVQALHVHPNISDSELFQSLADVREEPTEASSTPLPYTYQTLHRVFCHADGGYNLFLDIPYRHSEDNESGHLRGQGIVTNLDVFIERNKSLSFLVYKDYSCCAQNKSSERSRIPEPRHALSSFERTTPSTSDESVYIIAETFSDALHELLRGDNLRLTHHPNFEIRSTFYAPYLWLYHDRKFIKERLGTLSNVYQAHIELFLHYIDDAFGAKFDEIDSLLSRGLISADFLKYLFAPGDIFISHSPDVQAYVQNSWPEGIRRQYSDSSNNYVRSLEGSEPEESSVELTLQGSSWAFDGSFEKISTRFTVKHEGSPDDSIPIRELSKYPLKYADLEVAEALRARGKKFWDCRHKQYVCYNGWDTNHTEKSVDVRFMIDITTYKKMHPEAAISNKLLRNYLEPKVMDSEEPPDGDFLLLLPPNIFGFDMLEKKWVNLHAEHISPVVWNKEAFQSLVIDEDTKLLITALVTTQFGAEKSTDLMSGKGNGLIMLLHGGPGTGKTLTAESVAEIAEKPLYRVTCGDIGTNPEAVEKYLTTALSLGKTWGCVVLLDEADVFLEQRTLADLQRNALVSVFLRVLEYYDGILILTSNRVGTFDEAFKSRIQLSLHYESLTEPQRKLIWENFLKRLETFADDDIDTHEIRKHVAELAKYDMNGRQIRNAVTTARQVALYKKKKMGFEELRYVIDIASRFDKYLLGVNEGMSDERLAREDRVR